MLKKALAVLLAITGVVTFTFIGWLTTTGLSLAVAMIAFDPKGYLASHPNSWVAWLIGGIGIPFYFSGPVLGFLGGIYWAKGFFYEP